ncbi:CHAT domain-containing protein [Cellulomonas sp. Root485]|uniref:CHAT domain-containing protein n=1 Tax=Cellulomonas sp. Root485 TaxID=1736546 RepID=UPI001F3EFB8D|nr:CHAT domain-containing protein [Cellulomonas sp. Root485]
MADQATDMVARARRLHDPELLGLSLRVLAWTYRSLWDEASARRLLDEAVRTSRKHGLAHVEASALVSRATVLQEMGRTSAAARDLDDALVAVDRAEMDPAERALLHGRIRLSRAVLEQNAGRLLAAEQRYRALLAEGGLDVSRTVIATNNLAMLLAERGAFDEALLRADASVDLCDQAPGLLAPAIQTRAWIAVRAGRLREGMHDFERAAQAYSDAGIPLGEYYTEFADAMMDLRLLPEAATAAANAVRELEASGVSLMATEAQLRLARIALLTGDLASAQTHADAAAEAARHQRRAGWRDRAVLVGVEARLESRSVGVAEAGTARRAAGRLERAGNLHSAVEAYLVAGRVALAVDRPRDAIVTLGRAGDLARDGQVLVRLRGRLAGALAARAARRPAATLVECRSGLRDLAVHRSALPTIELRALASGHGAELGEIGLGVVLAGGSPAKALAWMERTRAAALLTRFPASDVPMADRRATSVVTGDSGQGRGIAVADSAPRVSAEDWARKGRASEGSSVPRFRGLAALREALDGRTLVEFGKFEGRLVAVVVEPRRARLVELGAEQDVATELRPLLFALRRLANPRGGAAADAARASADLRIARLRDLLIAPLGVGVHDELVVVPVGMLHGVPWSCLHDGPLAQAPSATFWVRTRLAAQERDAAGRTVLVAGPDLTGASEEVEALRAVHPGAHVLVDAGAGAGEVVDALADADLAHLACHGSPRADNPMFSSLLLADGPVTVQELHGAGVAPHRLVLASCHSGADVAYAGDEVLGFVSAMLAQGTAGVVASIAAVPDVAAVDLMLELHRGLRDGLTLARALHAARGRVDRSTPEGFVNWCTFSAHGAA